MDEEIDIQDSSTKVIDAEVIKLRTQLYTRLNEMTQEERELVTQIVQYDTMLEVLEAIKNMKKTTASTWKDLIKKLYALKGFKLSVGNFDYSAFLEKLIPLLGIFAGCLLALREAESAEIEAAEPKDEDNPLSGEALSIDNIFESYKNKSVILQYCNDKEKGFSL